ncbi:MAG: hypothetical protein PVI30_04720 [Myxococcales bacterium]
MSKPGKARDDDSAPAGLSWGRGAEQSGEQVHPQRAAESAGRAVQPPPPAGAPQPPPPAGQDPVAALFSGNAKAAGVADPLPPSDDDPVGRLFSADGQSAGRIADAGDELNRWETASRTSLFDAVADPDAASDSMNAPERIADPAPPAAPDLEVEADASEPLDADAVMKLETPAPPPPVELEPPPPAAPPQLEVDDGPALELDAPAADGAAAPPPQPRRANGLAGTGVVIEPPPPAAPPEPDRPRGKRRRRRTTRDKQKGERPPAVAGQRAAADETVEATGRRPRRSRGGLGKNLALVGLGLLALLAGAAVAVFLGVLPNPLSGPQPRAARRPPSPPAAKSAEPAAPPGGVQKAGAEPPAEASAAAAQRQVDGERAAAEPADETDEQPGAQGEADGERAAEQAAAATAEGRVAEQKAAPGKDARSEVEATAARDEDDGDAARARDDDDDLLKMILAARHQLSIDEPGDAEAIMRRALARHPNDHHVMEVLARAMMAQDRADEAVKYARQIVKRRRRRVSYRLLLGDALLMAGDEAGAKKQWRTVLKIDPGNRGAKSRLGG